MNGPSWEDRARRLTRENVVNYGYSDERRRWRGGVSGLPRGGGGRAAAAAPAAAQRTKIPKSLLRDTAVKR
jgi:hypothetical protein